MHSAIILRSNATSLRDFCLNSETYLTNEYHDISYTYRLLKNSYINYDNIIISLNSKLGLSFSLNHTTRIECSIQWLYITIRVSVPKATNHRPGALSYPLVHYSSVYFHWKTGFYYGRWTSLCRRKDHWITSHLKKSFWGFSPSCHGAPTAQGLWVLGATC